MKKSSKKKTKCNKCKTLFVKVKSEKSCSSCRIKCTRCSQVRDLIKGKCQPCIDELSTLTEKEKKKDYSLSSKYGITYPEYKAMLDEQHGVCWICHRPPAKLSLSVDHKHVKGERKLDLRLRRNQVRGLICYPCNKALGVMRDNSEAFRRASIYLEEWPARRILYKETNSNYVN